MGDFALREDERRSCTEAEACQIRSDFPDNAHPKQFAIAIGECASAPSARVTSLHTNGVYPTNNI